MALKGRAFFCLPGPFVVTFPDVKTNVFLHLLNVGDAYRLNFRPTAAPLVILQNLQMPWSFSPFNQFLFE
ncbi:hypothetical protein, partial [Bacillus licheniformis]|uniref:hypothetical protein n=1 Tax=Bacillus licheniformis TaxID=1402 RepID=UPI00209AA9C0